MDVFIIFSMSMEITPVILSAAKDLCAHRDRPFAALRVNPAKGRSREAFSPNVWWGREMYHRLFPVALALYYPSFLDMLTQAVVVMLDVRWQASVLMGVSRR